MAHHDDELEQRSTPELFALYRQILRQLRTRGVVRTENAPAGDYAEFLVASALGGTLAPNSEKSFDVLVGDLRIQVKARVLSDPPKSGQLQLSPFRSFDFDEAIIVLFDDLDYGVRQAVRVPVDAVRAGRSCTINTSTGTSFTTTSERCLSACREQPTSRQLLKAAT